MARFQTHQKLGQSVIVDVEVKGERKIAFYRNASQKALTKRSLTYSQMEATNYVVRA